MSIIDFALGGGLLALVFLAARRLQPLRSEAGSGQAFTSTIVASSFLIALVSVLAGWLNGAGNPWNAARLTPALALHEGVKLYWPMNSGPVMSTVVGPVAFLFYWPVGLLPAASPTTLILAASAFNLVAAAALAAWTVRRSQADPFVTGMALLIGTHLSLHFEAVTTALLSIHSDAPALLLISAGVLTLAFSKENPGWLRLGSVSLCLALAFWSKQSVLPIYAAAALVAWLRFGREAALKLIGTSILTTTIVSGLLLRGSDWHDIYQNMVAVPANHPWWKIDPVSGIIDATRHADSPSDRIKMVASAGFHLVRSYWPIVLALGGATLREYFDPDRGARPQPRWIAFLVVAIFMLPTAALGRLKVGGSINHEAFFVCFLIVALMLWLIELPPTVWSPNAYRFLTLALGLLCLMNLPQVRGYHGWRKTWDNQNEIAFRYLRNHPGQIYFPWNPLSSWLAEHRLYHFDYGVFDRNLGHAAVTPLHLEAHLPSNRPVIASYYAHHDYILKTYFPGYKELAPVDGLPEWRIYGPEPAR